MATAGSILSDVRVMFGDPDRDYISDAIGLDWLNTAQEKFCDDVEPLDEIKDYVITSKLTRYDLPTDCIIPNRLTWYKNRAVDLEYKTPDYWGELVEAYPTPGTGTPELYTIERRQIVLGPLTPTSNSATALASGAMGAADTTLNLTAASGTFRSRGWVRVGSTTTEIVEYTGVATTTLTGCTRAVHGTTAAAYSSGASVVEIDLQMLYRKAPTNMTATTDSPQIPAIYHRYLGKYVLYLGWLARGDSAKAQAALMEYTDLVEKARKSVSRRSRDGVLNIKDKISRWHASW